MDGNQGKSLSGSVRIVYGRDRSQLGALVKKFMIFILDLEDIASLRHEKRMAFDDNSFAVGDEVEVKFEFALALPVH
jgi:hypothetical protein